MDPSGRVVDEFNLDGLMNQFFPIFFGGFGQHLPIWEPPLGNIAQGAVSTANWPVRLMLRTRLTEVSFQVFLVQALSSPHFD